MICKAKLKRTKPMYRSQFEYVASLLPKGEVKNAKITLAAPEWFHLRRVSSIVFRKPYEPLLI